MIKKRYLLLLIINFIITPCAAMHVIDLTILSDEEERQSIESLRICDNLLREINKDPTMKTMKTTTLKTINDPTNPFFDDMQINFLESLIFGQMKIIFNLGNTNKSFLEEMAPLVKEANVIYCMLNALSGKSSKPKLYSIIGHELVDK